MAIHLSGGAPIGSVIVEGKHAPVRALACPLLAITTSSDESPLEPAQKSPRTSLLKVYLWSGTGRVKDANKKAGRALPASYNSQPSKPENAAYIQGKLRKPVGKTVDLAPTMRINTH